MRFQNIDGLGLRDLLSHEHRAAHIVRRTNSLNIGTVKSISPHRGE